MMSIDELKQKFTEIYGEGKMSGYFSPGRVNLIGEHTDYNGGHVFPCAISYGTWCIIRKNNTQTFRFASLNSSTTDQVQIKNILTPLEKGNWVNYPLGTIAQFQKQGFTFKQGADILIYGNVPGGAGLSSSAALEVVTAVAINNLYLFGLSQVELALIGQKAEREFAGVNCGIMDQFASAMGAENHAIYLDCDTLEYELVPVKLEKMKIVIGNTNSPHSLDSGVYNQRVEQCNMALDAIKPHKPVKNLAQLSMSEFVKLEKHIADSTIKRRARHVVSEIERTKEAVEALKEKNFEKFGHLMNLSHNSLRDDYEVTGFELDTMVNEARKIEGVIGSRMTGGGFGGSTVSLVADESVDKFIEVVGKNYEKQTGIKPEFYIAQISQGGHKIF